MAKPRKTLRPHKRRVHDGLVEAIGRDILHAKLSEGQALPNEEALCARHRVGRNALREAVKVLGAKGLVVAAPRRGTRVRSRASWNLLDPDVLAWSAGSDLHVELLGSLIEARAVIEPAAAALAAERATGNDLATIEAALADMETAEDDRDAHIAADVRYHTAILVASRNHIFMQLSVILDAALRRAFGQTHTWVKMRDALALHRGVAEAIRTRDAASARAGMQELIAPVLAKAKRPASTRTQRIHR